MGPDPGRHGGWWSPGRGSSSQRPRTRTPGVVPHVVTADRQKVSERTGDLWEHTSAGRTPFATRAALSGLRGYLFPVFDVNGVDTSFFSLVLEGFC